MMPNPFICSAISKRQVPRVINLIFAWQLPWTMAPGGVDSCRIGTYRAISGRRADRISARVDGLWAALQTNVAPVFDWRRCRLPAI